MVVSPELLGVHLAQPLVALDVDVSGTLGPSRGPSSSRHSGSDSRSFVTDHYQRVWLSFAVCLHSRRRRLYFGLAGQLDALMSPLAGVGSTS